MAPPPGTLRVGRYFLAMLALMAVLYALVFLPGERHTPKLGLDLVGGTQVIFQARTSNGSAPTSSSMQQAQQIIQDRVNGTGVTEADVVIQGDDQLVVSIPGGTIKDAAKLGEAAVLNMRGLVAPPVPIACGAKAAATTGTSTASPSSGATAGTTSGASTVLQQAGRRRRHRPRVPPATLPANVR